MPSIVYPAYALLLTLVVDSHAFSLQGMGQTQPGPKRRRLQLERNLDAEVAGGSLTREVLERKLLEHVESVDASMVRLE